MIDKDDFRKAVYCIVAAVPQGKVMSYGSVARSAGYPGYHRLVARVLKGASSQLGLPCHRIVNNQGRLVPGWKNQKVLLLAEKVIIKSNGCVDMGRCSWNPMEDLSVF